MEACSFYKASGAVDCGAWQSSYFYCSLVYLSSRGLGPGGILFLFYRVCWNLCMHSSPPFPTSKALWTTRSIQTLLELPHLYLVVPNSCWPSTSLSTLYRILLYRIHAVSAFIVQPTPPMVYCRRFAYYENRAVLNDTIREPARQSLPRSTTNGEDRRSTFNVCHKFLIHLKVRRSWPLGFHPQNRSFIAQA